MKYIKNFWIIIAGMILVLLVFSACKKESGIEIMQRSIRTIDSIETIYFKQDMMRTNPRNTSDTIERFREMYFKRLPSDSIVGVKGHWYMYVHDRENVIYEDIFDGKRIIRKNNRDSVALIYDLVEYPAFKEKHFWGHNTLFGMQHEFRYMLDHLDSFTIKRLKDTIVGDRNCFQVNVGLENKTTMPGFAIQLEKSPGSMSNTLYYFDKESYYPIKIKAENYSIENPEQIMFFEQFYYDIAFNPFIDEALQFNTSENMLEGYELRLMQPDPIR